MKLVYDLSPRESHWYSIRKEGHGFDWRRELKIFSLESHAHDLLNNFI